jgi:hypothetical protein
VVATRLNDLVGGSTNLKWREGFGRQTATAPARTAASSSASTTSTAASSTVSTIASGAATRASTSAASTPASTFVRGNEVLASVTPYSEQPDSATDEHHDHPPVKENRTDCLRKQNRGTGHHDTEAERN